MTIRDSFSLSLIATALCLVAARSDAHAEAVKWRNNLDAAKIEASQTGKLVLLHFWTPSCGPCRKLEAEVFSQLQIGTMMEQSYVPVKINADLSPALAGSFNIDRVPSDVVLTPQGNVVAKLACPPTPAGYGSQLVNLAQHYRQQVSTSQTLAQAPVQAAYAGLQVGQYNRPSVAATPMATQSPQSNGPPVIAPRVTHNIYATATPNPQAPGKPVRAAPNIYGDRYAAAPQQPAQQPAIAQTTPAQAVAPPQQVAAQSQPPASFVTTTAAPAVAKPAGPPKLPEGTPPLAFEGYCPVTLKQVRKWVMGDPKYGAIHRGRTYLFTSEAQRQQFLANPDSYSPVFSGIDPVKMLEENKTVEGSRQFGFEYRGAFYLFSSQESMTRFANQPDRYAAAVRQAMTRMDAPGSGTLLR